MEEFLIPMKLINLTKATLRNIKCRVKIQNQLSELFITEIGIRQGDALACLLFNVALEWAIRKSGIETRGTIFHKSVQVFAFADDINIIGRSQRVVKEAFLNFKKAAKEIGLIINEDKTKFMALTEYPINLCFLEVNGYKFEKVTQFKYLGTSISYDTDPSVEINNRIISANRSCCGLKKQLKSYLLSKQTKIKLHKTLY
jgi:hypothetical protein